MNLLPLAQEIAKVLGPNFEADGDGSAAIIRQTDGDPDFGILLWYHHNVKQIRVSGMYPKAADGREFPDSQDQANPIGVGEGRGAEAIATAINQRFMPTYRQIFNRAIPARDAHNAYLTKQQRIAERFAAILHGSVRPSGDRVTGGPLSYAQRFNGGSLRDDIYVNASQDTVNINLSGVPADIAEKLLRTWLADWQPECRNCHELLDDKDVCQNRECDRCGKSGL